MDLISITAGCVALDDRIAKSLPALASFVRHVREARSDVDAVSRELHSLQAVLSLLKEDAVLFPPELAEHTPTIVEYCSHIIDELYGSISTFNDLVLSNQEKRHKWLSVGRAEIENFRTTLEAHKAALGLAIDLVGATSVRDAMSDSRRENRTTLERRQSDSDEMTDISRILIQMGQLHVRLAGESGKPISQLHLHDYMGYMKRYAETIIRRKEAEHAVEWQSKRPPKTIELGAFVGETQMFGAYVGDGPDSAIDIDADILEFEKFNLLSVDRDGDRIDEAALPTDEMMSPVIDIPSCAPTPPPRNARRLEVARNKMVSPFMDEPDLPTRQYGVITEITSGGRPFAPSINSDKGRGFGRFFPSFKGSSSFERRSSTPAADISANEPAELKPTVPVTQRSLVRRGSRRLSVSIKNLPLWHMEQPKEVTNLETKAVFGVPLQKSMQIAKGQSKTHHGDNGSSRRDFPLCMQKCCFFVKNQGVTAPDIFAEPGDMFRVSKLKEIFSMGPTYGGDINFENYTVYDAADLIMLYLSQLPRPLIPESLTKRWISLSRQATLPGSHATRLDQCIDFWEEALSGLRGPSRSLFKLLLNLWATVASGEEVNDMTAERLADVVLKPLMHVQSGQHRTDYMLSLAFLIRKRAEYMQLLAANESAVKRIDRAAW